MTHHSENGYNLAVFSDFDGTISTRDVGNRLFHHFSDGKSIEPVRRWKSGEIDSRQCFLDEAALMRDITQAELDRFIEGFELDPHFKKFVSWCRMKNLPFYILSDGHDFYIKKLLRDNDLTGLQVYANQAVLQDGRMKFSWPWLEHSCGRCANCKGHHIRRLRKPGQKTVYIGDGLSDLCALKEADIIFAKDFLASHCQEFNIDYFPFDSFADVINILNLPNKLYNKISNATKGDNR